MPLQWYLGVSHLHLKWHPRGFSKKFWADLPFSHSAPLQLCNHSTSTRKNHFHWFRLIQVGVPFLVCMTPTHPFFWLLTTLHGGVFAVKMMHMTDIWFQWMQLFILQKPDVFLFLIRQLQLYLPLPKQPLSPDYQVAKGERADQLEFVNLILESLVLMFRETEVLPSRLHCLKVCIRLVGHWTVLFGQGQNLVFRGW